MVDRDFQCTNILDTTLAISPINILWGIPTKPAAGVMATMPTTAPIQNPSAEGFRPLAASNRIQPNPAAAVAVLVVAKADAASPLAPRAEPALNPNQTNQTKPIPKKNKRTFIHAI